MGYPIDVAIVGGDGTVLTARRALPSGRVHSCRGGFLTLERPASEEEWFEAGQRLRANSLTVVYDAALQGGKIP
jgi:NAD kinase